VSTGHNFWFEILGIIAACLTTFSFLPQAFRIWRSRSARDVSLAMYLMMTSGTVLWLIYGALIGSVALLFANGTGLLLVGSVLALKIQDMLRRPNSTANLLVEIVAAEAVVDPVPPVEPVNSNVQPRLSPTAAA
jgi:MtN3 and saliva related transmembrane protein